MTLLLKKHFSETWQTQSYSCIILYELITNYKATKNWLFMERWKIRKISITRLDTSQIVKGWGEGRLALLVTPPVSRTSWAKKHIFQWNFEIWKAIYSLFDIISIKTVWWNVVLFGILFWSVFISKGFPFVNKINL